MLTNMKTKLKTLATNPAAQRGRIPCHQNRVVAAMLLAGLQLISVHGQDLEFSTDRLSPEPWNPADILLSLGTGVRIPGTDLGLSPRDEMDAFSYGDDEIEPLGRYFFTRVAFSVDRGALGSGGAVASQAMLNGAAGDKFQVTVVGFQGGLFALPSQLLSDAPNHNLTPNDVSNLDGLALRKAGAAGFPIYYSVTNGHPIWGGADIIMVTTNGAPPQVFATAAQLGLLPGDDIDALAIGTVPGGGSPPTSLGPNVVVWVSLKAGSPTRGLVQALGGADGVLQIWPGPTAVVLDSTALDLAPADELDALTGLDPGPARALLRNSMLLDKKRNIGGNKVGTVTWNDIGSYTIDGGGFDCWDQKDEFTFAYQEITGDFDVQVRVESFTGYHWSKAGIMVRESLSEFCRRAFLRVTPANGANDTKLGYRTGLDNNAGVNGGQHEDSSTGQNPPTHPNAWLRLVRTGNVLTAYKGTDGNTWTQLAAQNTTSWGGGALKKSLYLGLAVSANYGSGSKAKAEFRNLKRNYGPTAAVSGASSDHPTKIKVHLNKPIKRDSITPDKFNVLQPGPTVVTGVRFTTANDNPNRDPMTFTLEGTTGSPLEGPWTAIASGNTGLPTTRLTAGPNQTFANTTACTSYRISFPAVRDPLTAAGMQVAEVALLNASGTDITQPGDPLIPSSHNCPANEQGPNVIDNNVNTKYMNFDKLDTGFIVSPTGGGGVTPVTIIGANQVAETAVILETASPLDEGIQHMISVAGVELVDGSTVFGTATFIPGQGLEPSRVHVRLIKTDDWGAFPGSDAAREGIGDTTAVVSGFYQGTLGNSSFENPIPDSPNNERFSTAMFGLLNITTPGDYQFYICSDDRALLYLSTDENPANLVEIAREPEWANRRQYVTPGSPGSRGFPPVNCAEVNLGTGKYVLQASGVEWLIGNNLSVAWQPPGGPPVGDGADPIAGANVEITRHSGGTFFKELGDVNIVSHPASQTVQQCRAATFTVECDGTPPYVCQWYENGGLIPGATGRTYTIPQVTSGMNGNSYSVCVRNEYNQVCSQTATLTVTPDTTPPTIVRANSFAVPEQIIFVCFSEPVDKATAENKDNYRINGGSPGSGIESVVIPPYNTKVVMIHLTDRISGAFTVEATGVSDCAGNTTTSSCQGEADDWTESVIGTPTPPGQTVANCDGSISITGGGGGLWNFTDQGRFLHQGIEGNFDIKVQINGIEWTGQNSMGGPFARSGTTPDAAIIGIYSNNGKPGTAVREFPGNPYWRFGETPTPASWLRLKRVGDTYTTYISMDGSAWTLDEEWTVTGPLAGSGEKLVGIVVTSQEANRPVTYRISNLTLTPDPSASPTHASTGGSGQVEPGSDPDDPISTFSGELFLPQPPDLNLGGPLPLLFSRYYAAFLERNGILHSLGPNWTHNFNWKLKRTGSLADVISDTGRATRFTNTVGTTWFQVGQFDQPFQLIESGGGFVLGDPRTQLEYQFAADGKLVAIRDGRGNQHTLTYTGTNLTEVADSLGRVLSFTHVAGKLTQVSDGTRTVGFGYTANLLTSVTNPLGQVTAYTYDPASSWPGLLTGVVLPKGNAPLSQQFTGQGRVTMQTDTLGNPMTFLYAGLTTTITDALGNNLAHTHGTNGQLLSIRDRNDQTMQFGYDAAGRRNRVTDRLGAITTLGFHNASGLENSVVEANGGTTINLLSPRAAGGLMQYDLTRTELPDGGSIEVAYDANGNPISLTDQAANQWQATYNGSGQLLSATNPLNGVTLRSYNADGTLASARDPGSNTTSFAYDALRRVNTVTNADGTTVAITYDANDRRLSVTDETSATTRFDYDANGNLVRRTDALSNAVNYAYDALDRLVRATNRLGHVSTFTYDALSRLQSATDPNGSRVTLGYDALSRLTSITDPASNVWQMTYDAEGIPTAFIDPLGKTNHFVSNEMGWRTQATDPLGAVRSFAYDVMGRLTNITDELGEPTALAYDPRGLLTAIARPGGITNVLQRDALGSLAGVTDAGGGQWGYGRDSQGRLVSKTDPLGQTSTHTYNNRNRIQTTTFAGGLGSVARSYDGRRRITRLEYSDGLIQEFNRDALGRITNATGLSLSRDAEGRITHCNGLAIARDPGGRISSIAYPPGLVQYTYDPRGLVTAVQDWTGRTTTFAYDAAGRLTSITRSNGVATLVGYDANDRITSVEERHAGTNILVSTTLTRDPRGNVTIANRNVPVPLQFSAGDQQYAVDAASQVIGWSYDALGRLLQDGRRSNTWNLASHLTSYTEAGNTVSFSYDAFRNRLTRTEGGVTRQFVWNYALRLASVAIERQGGADIYYYVHLPDGRLLYGINAVTGAARFYHYDEMGNTLALTDEAGTVIAAYAWSPYGERLGATGVTDNPFTWQGAYGVMAEGTAGLYYLRARYYDAAAARFLSRDPIRSTDPLRFNPYQYAASNPIRYIDPLGLQSYDEVAGGISEILREAWGASFDNSYKQKVESLTIKQEEMARVRGWFAPPTAGLGYTFTESGITPPGDSPYQITVPTNARESADKLRQRIKDLDDTIRELKSDWERALINPDWSYRHQRASASDRLKRAQIERELLQEQLDKLEDKGEWILDEIDEVPVIS